MKELKLLIVEDDSAVIDTYIRDITSYNKSNRELNIVQTVLSDKEAAIKLLKNADFIFDGAVIDLDLKNSGGTDSSGNEVIKEVKGNLRFPVFVISGTCHNLEADLKEETAFFKVRERDGDFDFIEEIVAIFNTGITQILNRKGTIENYINDIFWNHLSKSLDLWTNDVQRSPEEKHKSLLRYTLLHMNEYIDEAVGKYHPCEFLIIKPIKENIFTGDIIEKEGINYIILTPSCDIVLRADGSRNAERILLCKIKKIEDVVSDFNTINASTGSNNNTRKKVIALIENKKQNYHFVPQNKIIPGSLIDFQDKYTIDLASFTDDVNSGIYKRIATVSMPFLKDIISRYSNYFSRQGSPDFNSDEAYNLLFTD